MTALLRRRSASVYTGEDGHLWVEWCTDCGRSLPAERGAFCPYGTLSCGACSAERDRLGHTALECPAHGAYLPDPEPRS